MKVLFVCRSNRGRSQSAEAFFNELSKKNRALSGGTDVSKEGHQGWPPGSRVIVAMKRDGIDISKFKVKQVTLKMLEGSDLIVVFTTKNERRRSMPKYFNRFSGKIIFWDVSELRYVKDPDLIYERSKKIKRLVQGLVKRIG